MHGSGQHFLKKNWGPGTPWCDRRQKQSIAKGCSLLHVSSTLLSETWFPKAREGSRQLRPLFDPSCHCGRPNSSHCSYLPTSGTALKIYIKKAKEIQAYIYPTAMALLHFVMSYSDITHSDNVFLSRNKPTPQLFSTQFSTQCSSISWKQWEIHREEILCSGFVP